MNTFRHIRIPVLVALGSLMSMNLFAQSFVFETPKKFEINMKAIDWKDATIYYKNTSDKDLVIEWTVLSNTLVKGWDYSLCDNGQCYIGIPSKSETAPLPPSDKGFFKLAVSPENINGNGELVIMLTNKDNPDERDTIAFNVNVGITSSISSGTSQIQFGIFPSPARESLSVSSSGNMEGSVLSIITGTGKVISTRTLAAGERKISVSELSSGVYMLRIVTRNGAQGTRLFVKE